MGLMEVMQSINPDNPSVLQPCDEVIFRVLPAMVVSLVPVLREKREEAVITFKALFLKHQNQNPKCTACAGGCKCNSTIDTNSQS